MAVITGKKLVDLADDYLLQLPAIQVLYPRLLSAQSHQAGSGRLIQL
jgi:hypothetical protein